jgi:hypothetical protein
MNSHVKPQAIAKLVCGRNGLHAMEEQFRRHDIDKLRILPVVEADVHII